MRAPILSPRLEYGLNYHGKVPVLWERSFPYKYHLLNVRLFVSLLGQSGGPLTFFECQ
jgi:hypothetical protein